MKRLKTIVPAAMIATLMSSCGIQPAVTSNVYSSNTNVELSKNNYQVIDRVSGKSTTTYVLGIGGLSNKALVENAKANMLEKTNLTGGSKAIINMTTDSHLSIVYPFFFRKTVTVSGHVIEFTEQASPTVEAKQ